MIVGGAVVVFIVEVVFVNIVPFAVVGSGIFVVFFFLVGIVFTVAFVAAESGGSDCALLLLLLLFRISHFS